MVTAAEIQKKAELEVQKWKENSFQIKCEYFVRELLRCNSIIQKLESDFSELKASWNNNSYTPFNDEPTHRR